MASTEAPKMNAIDVAFHPWNTLSDLLPHEKVSERMVANWSAMAIVSHSFQNKENRENLRHNSASCCICGRGHEEQDT